VNEEVYEVGRRDDILRHHRPHALRLPVAAWAGALRDPNVPSLIEPQSGHGLALHSRLRRRRRRRANSLANRSARSPGRRTGRRPSTPPRHDRRPGNKGRLHAGPRLLVGPARDWEVRRAAAVSLAAHCGGGDQGRASRLDNPRAGGAKRSDFCPVISSRARAWSAVRRRHKDERLQLRLQTGSPVLPRVRQRPQHPAVSQCSVESRPHRPKRSRLNASGYAPALKPCPPHR
jgi:hypothetical protein